MKKLNFLFVIPILFLALSCNRSETEADSDNRDITIVKMEYVLSEFILYKPTPLIFPILDSTIKSVNACPELKKMNYIFCVSIYEKMNYFTEISIELREIGRIYCSNINGVFIYKKAPFILCNEIKGTQYFTNTGKAVKFKCLKDNLFTHDIDDSQKGIWKFVIKNDQIKCIGFGICGDQWMDEGYYETDSI